jgi:hypothetical protein
MVSVAALAAYLAGINALVILATPGLCLAAVIVHQLDWVGGVPEDRADDGLPVASIDPVTGPLERHQARIRNRLGQRLAVLKRDHRIGGPVDHQGRRGDRGQGLVGAPVVREGIVVLSGGEVVCPRDVAGCSA